MNSQQVIKERNACEMFHFIRNQVPIYQTSPNLLQIKSKWFKQILVNDKTGCRVFGFNKSLRGLAYTNSLRATMLTRLNRPRHLSFKQDLLLPQGQKNVYRQVSSMLGTRTHNWGPGWRDTFRCGVRSVTSSCGSREVTESQYPSLTSPTLVNCALVLAPVLKY